MHPVLDSSTGSPAPVRPETLQLAARLEANLGDSRLLMMCGIRFDHGVPALAVQLGNCLAMMRGREVAALDCALEISGRPEFASLKGEKGLLHQLAERSLNRPAATGESIQGLRLLRLAGNEGMTRDMVMRTDLKALGAALRERYVLGILVAEPLLSSPIANLLMNVVDGVVLAVSAGADRRDDIAAAMSLLEQSGVPIFGYVMIES